MDKKIVSVIAIFAVLMMGTVAVLALEDTETTTVTFDSAIQGYVITPMASGCGYFCSKCVPLNGGACTAAKACC